MTDLQQVKTSAEKMWQFDSSVSEIIRHTPDIWSFRFPRNKDMDYLAGQFFHVTIKVQEEELIHHFSFSSSPTETGYIQFTKRITSSPYSQALAGMKPGSWARLRGPAGTFTLPPEPRKLGFISGGIGITPLRSMLRYLTDKRLPSDVILLYSCNSFEEFIFRDEFEEMAAKVPSIRFEPVISGQTVPPDWRGHLGYINKDLIARLATDYSERLFYVSGPPKMVLALKEELTKLNIPDSQIKRDSFTGYD